MRREIKIENFKYGQVDSIEDKSIPRGAASASLNFVTKGDKIELRRGNQIMGTAITGNGRITGLKKALKADGTEILFRSYGTKVQYYDTATLDWIEIGTDILTTLADGEDVAFAPYYSLAGHQMWLSSPNSSLFKIMVANHASYTDMYDAVKNFKGLIDIRKNRMWLWQKKEYDAGIYLSYIDAQTSFATVTSENIGTGDGSTKTFTGTLAFKAGGAKRTCFAIEVTDTSGSETFTDDRNGVLTGTNGGTGTINYTTGAISVTFNTAPILSDAILCTYQYEDSTNKGIADFTYSATRLAAEGDIIRQDDGGKLQNILFIKDIAYCFHKLKTWYLQLTIDDTNAVNENYRDRVSIPNWRAAVETGEGIFFVDDADKEKPRLRLLTFDVSGSDQVVPVDISNNLNLEGYEFDKAAGIAWGDLVIFACRTSDSTYNNRVLVYDRLWKSFDVHDYTASCFEIYDGELKAGDSISNNVYTLFSGFDDDDSEITGYWITGKDQLDYDGLKRTRLLQLQGEIQENQKAKVYVSVDNGGFVEVKNSGDTYAIDGQGSYVDIGQAVNVGSLTVGSKEVGGGSDAVLAYYYKTEIKLGLDNFNNIKIKIEPQGIGYLSVSMIKPRDIRIRGQKLPKKYR